MTANKEKNMKLARIGVLAVALAATAAFIGVGLPEGAKGDAPQTTHGITVTGTGKASTVPDRASFWFGVETRRKTAEEASGANSAAMQKLIDALRNAGVADKDMQTVDVSVSPVYSDSGSEVIGYTASNSVTVTVDVASAGSVVDAAVGAGADQVEGPSLTKADTDALYRDALRAAVADARGHAEALAAAAGVSVGPVISIQEGSTAPGPIAVDTTTAGPRSTPIQAGTLDVQATVTVTYAIA